MKYIELTLPLIVPLIVGVVLWFLNERAKRLSDEFRRKEESYRILLHSAWGLRVGQHNKELTSAFLEEIDRCWLYCPDNVIRPVYAFAETIPTGAGTSERQRATAFGALVVEIRKDLLSRRVVRRTELTSNDYRLFGATDVPR